MEEASKALAVISLIVAMALANLAFDKHFRVPAKHFMPYLAGIAHIAIGLNVRPDMDIYYYSGFVLIVLIGIHGCSYLIHRLPNRGSDNEH